MYCYIFVLMLTSAAYGMAPVVPTQNVPVGPIAAPVLQWQNRPSEESGVTTINEARGNWYFKAQILKDARNLYNKILKKVTAITPLQEKFISDRASVDRILSEFNQEYGFQGGEIDERMKSFEAQIKEYQETYGVLDKEAELFLEDLNIKKHDIEEFKKQYDYLQKLDAALSQGLATMSSQLTKASSYEEQSWQHYEKIEETLNDEQAEELLHKMQIAYDNIGAIEHYLTEQFRIFFASTIEQVKQQVEKVKKEIIQLKTRGVALGKKMRDLQEKDDAERRALEEEQTRERIAREQKSKRTWLSPVFETINGIWIAIRDTVVGWYASVMNWLFAKPKVVVVDTCPVTEPIVPQPELPEEEAAEPQADEELEEVVAEKEEIERATEPQVRPTPLVPEPKIPELSKPVLPMETPPLPVKPDNQEEKPETIKPEEPAEKQIEEEGIEESVEVELPEVVEDKSDESVLE